jgi:hypothetical protein
MERYHVRLGKRRTTVSVDNIVSEYLALHSGTEPGRISRHRGDAPATVSSC